jgi:ElaB/YqjD/DUF883 family membrane-anchored ribosome-binding protein
MSAPPPTGPSATGKRHEAGDSAAERIGEAWQSTRETVREGAQAVARQAQNSWEDAGQLIRRNPMAAVAVGFGAGFLLGCCLTNWFSAWPADMTDRMSRASA